MRLNDHHVEELLRKIGAVRKGHFVYKSGRHGNEYINKDALFMYPRELSMICKEMVERFHVDGFVGRVIGPAVGGAILAQWVAHHLQSIYPSRDVRALFAEKDGDAFIIKRGYDEVIKGTRTLVVEDVVTTGDSARKVVEAAQRAGAIVAGVFALWNRGGRAINVGNVPFHALISTEIESYPEKACYLCEQNVPVNIDVGHGREYLARKKQNPE